jgi:hypothetical protein
MEKILTKRHLKDAYKKIWKTQDYVKLEHFNQEGLELIYDNPVIKFVCPNFEQVFKFGNTSEKLVCFCKEQNYCYIKNKKTGTIWCKFVKESFDKYEIPSQHIIIDDTGQEYWQYCQEFEEHYGISGYQHGDSENFELVSKDIEICHYVVVD